MGTAHLVESPVGDVARPGDRAAEPGAAVRSTRPGVAAGQGTGTTVTFVLVELADERLLQETGARLVSGLDPDHTVARYGIGTVAVVADGGSAIARRVAGLAAHPVRVGWVTSDGAHSVHDVVTRA